MRKNKSIQKVLVTFPVWVALSMAFSSCGKDDEVTDPVDEASVLTVSVAENDGTVALAEGTTADLFAIEGSGSIVAQSTVTAVQHGQLTGAEAITAVMKDGIQLTGYTPSGLWTVDTYGQPKEFTVSTGQSTMENYEASDLRMAPLTAVTNGKAALVMNHVMTKVTVHLTDVTGNYDLSEAKMLIPGVHTSVTADLVQHTVATVENEMSDIFPYCNQNPYRASASAVVAPGKVTAGNDLVRVTVGGKEFTYKLLEDADWQAGTETVYNMRLTYEGLAPYGCYVTEWGDSETNLSGNLEEVLTYGVGDYLLKNGQFVKADKLAAEQAADVVAVVVGDVVSEEDAAEGYNAYVMGLESVDGKSYGIVNQVGENVQDYPVAFADLNGRTNTETLMAGAEYQALADKAGTVFGSLDAYAQKYPLPTSVASGWFVPSFGQMMQLLNNLGQAGLTVETKVEPGNFNPFYTSSKVEVFEGINVSVEPVTGGTLLTTEAAKVYVTSTEAGTNFWCVQSRIEDGSWQWCFGRNPGRSGNNRTLLPCAAVKLP